MDSHTSTGIPLIYMVDILNRFILLDLVLDASGVEVAIQGLL